MPPTLEDAINLIEKLLAAQADREKAWIRHDTGCHPSEQRHTQNCIAKKLWVAEARNMVRKHREK